MYFTRFCCLILMVTTSLVFSIEDEPIPPPDPCLEVECREGWVCTAVDIPHCDVYPAIGNVCDPTPVCIPAPKIGSCPVMNRAADLERICETMVCFQDDNCPGDQKCCEAEDCGKVCLDPVINMEALD